MILYLRPNQFSGNGDVSIGTLPADKSPVTWKAHKGPVVALLALFSTHVWDHYSYLITGGNDFYVKIWNLTYGLFFFFFMVDFSKK